MNVFLSAGEPSGEEHAAKIAAALSSLLDECTIFGMGGSHMRAAGVETILDSERDASIMGFLEVVLKLPHILSLLRTIKAELARRRPAVVVLVDYQDFHFRVARIAKTLGIPTVFVVSPSIWAWRKSRIETVKRYVDRLACIFPFEPEIYHQAGYANAFFVGHPLVEESLRLSQTERQQIRAEITGGNLSDQILAVLPGSRVSEVRRHLPALRETIAVLLQKKKNLRIVLPLRPSIRPIVQSALDMVGDEDRLTFSEQPGSHIMQAADAGLIKSGTSNLQAACAKLPFAMFFKTSLLSEMIVRTLSSLRSFSMVNIIRPDTVKEYVQRECTPENLALEALRLLDDESYRLQLQEAFTEVEAALAGYSLHPQFSEEQSVFERIALLTKELVSDSTR